MHFGNSTPARTAIHRNPWVAGASVALTVTLSWAVAAAADASTALPAAGSAPTSSVRSNVSRAEKHVDAVLARYRAARQGSGESHRLVRAESLSPAADQALDAWARRHPGIDPVFRGQGIPEKWTLSYEGSQTGTTSVKAVHHWSDGTTTTVWYSVTLDNLLIVDAK